MRLRKKKTLIDQAGDVIESVRPRIETAVETAWDEARHLAVEAQKKAGPALAEAQKKAAPALADAQKKAVELGTTAYDRAAPALSEAKAKADVKVAQLKGEPVKKKKGGKLKKLVFFGALAAIGGVIFKKLRDNGSGDDWQSTYVPAPAPATKPAPVAEPATDDTAGASPDEALADQQDGPHAATDPSAPAEVVDIKTAGDDEPKS